jgi:Tol biopolymer transport system component
MGGSIWSVPLDASTGAATHPPSRLLFGGTPTAGPTGSTASLVVFEQAVIERVVERAGLDHAHAEDAAEILYADGNPTSRRASITSDGRLMAVERDGVSGRDIWVKDTRTGTQQLVVRTESTGVMSATISPDGRRITYNRDTGAEVTGATGTGYVVDVSGGVPKVVCEKCRLWGFMPDSRRAIATIADKTIRLIEVASDDGTDVLTDPEGTLDRPTVSSDGRWIAFRRQIGTGLKTYVAPVAATSTASASPIDEPTTTGRPAGWSPDSTILYLLLDTDGFRCLWAQRVDRATGRPVGAPTVARHLHNVVGVSTSYGNAVTAQGFVYEAVSVRSSLWRLGAPKP